MDERRTVAAGYDRLAGDYLAHRGDAGAGLVAEFADAVDGPVLDAGCGAGDPVTAALVDAGREVVGLDVSEAQLSLLGEHVPAARPVAGDLTALPLADGAVDGLVSAYALIHVPRSETPAALSEFHRVLAPGGELLVTMGAEAWEGTNPDWLDGGAEMYWSFGDREESLELLADAGFDVCEDDVVDDALDSAFTFVRARA